jgi:hypothetical protein
MRETTRSGCCRGRWLLQVSELEGSSLDQGANAMSRESKASDLNETVHGHVDAAFAGGSVAAALPHASAAAFLALMLSACGGGGQSGSAASSSGSSGMVSGGSDYSVMANWVCRPGEEDVCTTGLDALVQNVDGSTESLPFTAAADPAIDCFYIYPTVSKEQMQYADLTDSPEIQDITRAQVGRLSSRCRVFAPIYRQVTLYGVTEQMSGSFAQSDYPTADVQAAWAYYMANDNQGRGVVLIGHSQGTILLQNLIATSIDGQSSQKLLVSAFLAGDPSLGVPEGATVGGTFSHIPTCSDSAETGCVYVWASYPAGDTSDPMFGGRSFGGLVSACVSPAAPAGGSGALKFYHSNSEAPWWTELLGQYSGECQQDASGANIFVVSVNPGPLADQDTAILKAADIGGGWGLHPSDIALVQGNILDVLDAEIATWQAQH